MLRRNVLKYLAVMCCNVYKTLSNNWAVLNTSREREGEQIWQDECKCRVTDVHYFNSTALLEIGAVSESAAGSTLSMLYGGGCHICPPVQAGPGHLFRHLHTPCPFTELNRHLLFPLRWRPACGWSKWTRYQFSRWRSKTVFPRTGKPTLS